MDARKLAPVSAAGAKAIQDLELQEFTLWMADFRGTKVDRRHESSSPIAVLPQTSSFKCFRKLPLELRLIIYHCTIPEARLIKFGSVRVQAAYLSDQQFEEWKASKPMSNNAETVTESSSASSHGSFNLPWALLAVDRETRMYAQKIYQFAFENRLYNFNGGIYVDFERDTLVFENSVAISSLYSFHTDRRRISLSNMITYSDSGKEPTTSPRNIAVYGTCNNYPLYCLSIFPYLKKVDQGLYCDSDQKPIHTTWSDSDPSKQKWIQLRDKSVKRHNKMVESYRKYGWIWRQKFEGTEIISSPTVPEVRSWTRSDFRKIFGLE